MILKNDISKTSNRKDFYMYKHLATLPFYSLPRQVLAVTPDQVIGAVAGSKYIMPAGLNGSIPLPAGLENEKVVNPDFSNSAVVKNLL